MGNLGFPEILVIAVISLLVFGPKKLPEMARSAGRVLHEFKRVTGELTEELKAGLDEPPAPPPVTRDVPLTRTEMLPMQNLADGQGAGQDPPPGKDI